MDQRSEQISHLRKHADCKYAYEKKSQHNIKLGNCKLKQGTTIDLLDS